MGPVFPLPGLGRNCDTGKMCVCTHLLSFLAPLALLLAFHVLFHGFELHLGSLPNLANGFA